MVVSGGEGGTHPGSTEKGVTFESEGQKYGILKFGHFWQIPVCIADSDILHP